MKRNPKQKSNTNIIPLPLKIHQDGAFYPGQLLTWNKEQLKVEVKRSKNWRLTVVILIIFGAVGFNSMRHFSRRHNIAKMAYSCTLIGYCWGGLSIFICMVRNAREAAEFLNGCRVVEQTFKKNGITLIGNKLQSVLIKGFQLTARITPIIFLFGSLIMPCFPVNYGASLLQRCLEDNCNCNSAWGSSWNQPDVNLSSFLSWIVFVAAFNIGFTATTQTVVGLFFQISAQHGLQRLLDLKQNHGLMTIYRQLQFLHILFNQSHNGILIFALITMTGAEACWAYVIVRASPTAIPALIRVAALGMLLEMIWMQLVIYGYASTIHSLSSEGLRKELSKRSLDTILRKSLRSCPSLKIAFGASNYFEKITPLKCFEFSVERFADLLLTEKQWRQAL